MYIYLSKDSIQTHSHTHTQRPTIVCYTSFFRFLSSHSTTQLFGSSRGNQQQTENSIVNKNGPKQNNTTKQNKTKLI